MDLRKALPFAFLFLLSGCALYSEVSVAPLNLLPSNIERGADIQSMLRKADFIRAMEMAPTIEARQKPTASDLAGLGAAYLAAGRFDDARRTLRKALDLQPFRTTYAQVAWDLAQVEYLDNNFESSLEWVQIAMQHGLSVRQWHVDYVRELAHIPVYATDGYPSTRVPFHFGRPDVPRVTTRIDGKREVEAVIDSGAVLSIVSKRLAAELQIRPLGNFEGTFNGLLGEPIQVTFGLIEKLQIGDLTIANVPVAIMPDQKMRFLVSKKENREFHIDFLLGSNLLKEFRTTLDFDRRSVKLERLSPADRRVHPDQNLFFDDFRPHVRGAINRKGWFLFVLDTGSEITFLSQTQLSILPVQQLFGTGMHSATLQGLGGAMKSGSKLENVEVGFDGWSGKFKTIPMYDTEEKDLSVGIVGQNFLKNFNVVIDFGTMRLELERR